MKNKWMIGLLVLIALIVVYYLLSAKKTDEPKKEAAKTPAEGGGTAKRLYANRWSDNGLKTGGNIMCECNNGKICFSGNGGSGCSCCANSIEHVDNLASIKGPIRITGTSGEPLPFLTGKTVSQSL